MQGLLIRHIQGAHDPVEWRLFKLGKGSHHLWKAWQPLTQGPGIPKFLMGKFKPRQF